MDWTPDRVAQQVLTVASLPTVYFKLVETANDPNSTALDMVTIISADIGLSVRLMKLVNSAFFGYPSKIDSLARAVTVIGSKQLQDLALATSVMDMFKQVPEDLVTREAFWRHSIACGVMARILANYRREFNVERAFVSGLLHDIGRLIILMIIPDVAKKAFVLAQTQERLLFQAEMQVLGFTHAAAGAALLKRWQLPEQLIYAAAFHHRPSAANKFKADVALIHIADVMVNALYANSGEMFVPPLHSDAWDALGLPVQALGPMLTEFTQQYREMLSIVMPDLTV